MAKKIKGKDWYTIVAPKFFDEKVLGETPADDVKKIISRIVETPLITLTNDMSKFYIKIKFRIIRVEGSKAYTDVAGLECLRDYIARMIRHGINRIDIVQTLKTKDDKKIIVKSLVITNKKVTSSIQKKISKFVLETVEKTATDNKFDEFLTKILNDSLKNKILKDGSKIYPLRNFDVRRLDAK